MSPERGGTQTRQRHVAGAVAAMAGAGCLPAAIWDWGLGFFYSFPSLMWTQGGVLQFFPRLSLVGCTVGGPHHCW